MADVMEAIPSPAPAPADNPRAPANANDNDNAHPHLESSFANLNVSERHLGHDRRIKDKSDRSTVDGVLDDRTHLILQCLMKDGVFSDIWGCISTGKEAHVYTASVEDANNTLKHLAVKVYKTRILSFKERSRYIEGDIRFSGQLGAQISLWAHKEYRNLVRLAKAQIPCPEPIKVTDHVLVMGMLGIKDMPYPRLVDVKIEDPEEWTHLFKQLVASMRRMYQVCKLVHGDLSEYNILCHDGILYMIDVSQSVEHDQPNSSLFLRKDIMHVVEFFRRRGAHVLPDKTIYKYITSGKRSVEYEKMREEIDELYGEEASSDSETDNNVFRTRHIPHNLTNISLDTDPALLGHLISNGKNKDDEGTTDEESGGVNLDSDVSSSDEDEDGTFEDRPKKPPRGHRFEDPAVKKQRKAEAKESKRESRLTKMPKKEKKRKVMTTKRNFLKK